MLCFFFCFVFFLFLFFLFCFLFSFIYFILFLFVCFRFVLFLKQNLHLTFSKVSLGHVSCFRDFDE